jgi:hypothetical protein
MTMPFTFSHPAVVVPLHRYGLPLSALVAGSIAPDLCFYLRPITTPDRFGHSLPGVLSFSLPAAFASLWIFHRFLKAPLIAMAPSRYRAALAPFAARFDFLPLSRLCRVAAAIGVGIVSHLLWDFICHLNGWSGKPLAVLATPLFNSPLGPIRLFEALHVSFSIVGAAMILRWFQRWSTSDAVARQIPGIAGPPLAGAPVEKRPSKSEGPTTSLPHRQRLFANQASRRTPASHYGTLVAILQAHGRRLGMAAALGAATCLAALFISMLAGYTPDTCEGRRALLHHSVVIAISLWMGQTVLLSIVWHAIPSFRPVSASTTQPDGKESAHEHQ